MRRLRERLARGAHGAHLVYVGTRFGGRLHVADAPLLCAGLGLLGADLPPVLQVRLVPHQQEGNVLVLLHTKDLLPEAGAQRNRGQSQDMFLLQTDPQQ